MEIVTGTGEGHQPFAVKRRRPVPGAVVGLGGLGLITKTTLTFSHFDVRQDVVRKPSPGAIKDNLETIMSARGKFAKRSNRKSDESAPLRPAIVLET